VRGVPSGSQVIVPTYTSAGDSGKVVYLPEETDHRNTHFIRAGGHDPISGCEDRGKAVMIK
jgi:hypothetical protein